MFHPAALGKEGHFFFGRRHPALQGPINVKCAANPSTKLKQKMASENQHLLIMLKHFFLLKNLSHVPILNNLGVQFGLLDFDHGDFAPQTGI